MRFGCCVPLTRIDTARRNGFDYVELKVTESLMPLVSDAGWSAVRAEITSGGIPVEATNVFFPKDWPLVGRRRDLSATALYVEVAVERASQLGVKVESEAFSEYLQRRQVVEHRLARLVQLGIRQARYFGRTKTAFQLLMAATVANLTLVATKTGQMRSRRGQKNTSSTFLSQIWATAKAFWNHLIRYPVAPNLLSRYASPLHTGFRPHF